MGENDLIEAIKSGQIDQVRATIAKFGRPLNQAELSSALNTASFNGLVAIMSLLIEMGADVRAQAGNGITPLDCAVENLHLEAVALLLELGVEPNQVDEFGQTPLRRAIDSEVQRARSDSDREQMEMVPTSEITELLLRCGANPTAKTSRGETPMSWAAKMKHSAAVEAMKRAQLR